MAINKSAINQTHFDYCETDRQREVLANFLTNFSYSQTGRNLNCGESTIREMIGRIHMNAAKQGYSPESDMVHPVSRPFYIKGVSTNYDADGNIKSQWVKTNIELEEFAVDIQQAIEEFYDFKPEVVQPKFPELSGNFLEKDIIPWIQIGDAHLGMLAHAMETGKNFDLKIAERELQQGIISLFQQIPNCERVVINDLGDFTHYENFAAKTEASGHDLDFDTRFPKMIKVYSRLMRFIVDAALSKFQYVDVIINQGNHSRTNDVWMAELLRVHYENTKRVHVLNNDSVFIGYRMGKTFVMVHHSDKCKPNRLANVMATDFAKDWGECPFRYIDIGHIHHNMVLKEHPGVSIESFNILAPMDKYAHDAGYRSRQSITAVLRSKTYGEKGRITIPIQEVEDILHRKYGYDLSKTKEAYSI